MSCSASVYTLRDVPKENKTSKGPGFYTPRAQADSCCCNMALNAFKAILLKYKTRGRSGQSKPFPKEDLLPYTAATAVETSTEQFTEASYFTAAEQRNLTQSILNGNDVRQSQSIVHCASEGDAQAVWLMLQREVNIETRERVGATDPGITALEATAKQGHLLICQILLDHAALLNPVSASSTALFTAIKGADHPYRRFGHGPSPHRAATVRYLLQAGADPNCHFQSYDCFSALQAAAKLGEVEIGSILIAHGALIDAYEPRYGSALQTAIAGGHTEFVYLLLEKGANCNQPANPRGTGLALAAFNDKHPYSTTAPMERLMHRLLDLGADVNLEGGTLRSALQAAVLYSSKDII